MNALLKALEGVATSDPDVMSGTIVFAGTRVPVVHLLEHFSAGEGLESFLRDFPSVSREQTEEFLLRIGCLISPELYDLAPSR